MSQPVEFNDGNFEKEVISSDIPVLVDFWAEWCGPCKMLIPVINELASEYAGKAKIGKLNVDLNPENSAKYGVRSIPTLLVFKGGEIVDSIVGAVPKTQIAEKLDQAM